MLWPLERPLSYVRLLNNGSLLLGGTGLLWQKNSLDVGEDTTLGDGDSGQELVQLFVVTDGQLQMSWDDPGLLVVAGSVSCQFEDLCCKILHDGCQINWCPCSDTITIVALSQETMDTTDWELESGP